MSISRRRTRPVLLALLLAAGLAAPVAEGRPGGGNTFRSSSSSSTSRSSSSSSSPSRSSPSSPSRSSTSSPSWSSTPSRPSTSSPSWSSTPSRPSTSSPVSPYASDSTSYSSYSSSTLDLDRDRPSLFALFFESRRGTLLLGGLLVGFGLLVYRHQRKTQQSPAWATMVPAASLSLPVPPRPPPVSMRKRLEALRAHDPAFSLVLFEDFLYALYARAHEARGAGELDQLSPYLSESARCAISGPPLREVKAIVIGSFEIAGVEQTSSYVRVTVEFTSNYTEVRPDGSEQSYWAAESWHLVRRRVARSRPPEKARIIGCPNCGAPLSALRGDRCSYCGQIVDTGELDWRVERIVEMDKERRGPQLTGNTEEQGTDLPTIIDPDAKSRLEALSGRDPGFAWSTFQGRIQVIFDQLQIAWSSREWKHARPFVSDSLFQTQLYWMETYRKQRLRNITEDARIVWVQMAKITSDAYYDAVTVRVHATGLDYTIDETTGKVVSGSRERNRDYTEYWTLIRGSSRTGAPRATLACPNCGAPLDVTMAGNCAHCSAKVTSGEFDWVLSRIEQDEAYRG
ncbi:TIM44-like domain-containing protein [Sorangium sp. So ce406]|uniref:TIM44-like domain-containing protein n=1 Tax=Sorangium sp. So ce406 TaxID=3133311 RepID=UPI003F5C3518